MARRQRSSLPSHRPFLPEGPRRPAPRHQSLTTHVPWRPMLRLAPSHPVSLLLLVTALFTFLIQSGELGTSDTAHRLQVAHSLWTGQPQVFPNEYPEFGLHGRGGHLYACYGIGPS